MNAMRILGASIVASASLLVAVQGCALFTCIEDDCDSLSSGSGGKENVGGGASISATSSDGTATQATSSGVGGEGGAPPCTGDCPFCSEELPGAASSLTVRQGAVYVLAKVQDPTALFTLTDLPSGFGSPEPFPGDGHGPDGQLVATTETVFHVSGTSFTDILATQTCAVRFPTIAAAASGNDLWLLSTEGLQPYTGCTPLAPDPVAVGATSIASSQTRFVFDGNQNMTGPCWKSLPLEPGGAICVAKQKPLAVAANPAGKVILFRTAGRVISWTGDGTQGLDQIVDFGSTDEEALPIAASSSEVFFARSTAPETMWRCQYDPPYACRSTGSEAVTSIHVESETAYFTMGKRVCKWP